MKILHLLAAAGIMAAGLGSTSAEAQRYDHNRYNHDRGYHNGWRGDHGYRGRGYNRCHTEWRHHRRVEICR